MSAALPTWRSLLFVPADNPRLLAKAHLRGADALVLDLEDAVLPAAKAGARRALPFEADRLHALGATVLVRINSPGLAALDDLRAAVRPSVAGIVVPKVERTGWIAELAGFVRELEAEEDAIAIVATIESPAGLLHVSAVAAVAGVSALALGGEDFALALGVPPTPACLTLPCQTIALAAAGSGKMAIGLPASLANFDDPEGLRAAAIMARAIGFHGAFCIHPRQVAVVNEAFAPASGELALAHRTISAWAERAEGQGAVALDGRMIDKPVVERALATLARAGAPLGRG